MFKSSNRKTAMIKLAIDKLKQILQELVRAVIVVNVK